MKKYIPYSIFALIIFSIFSIASYLLSPLQIDKVQYAIFSTIGAVMFVIIVCMVGKILSEKDLFIVEKYKKLRDRSDD